MILLIDDDPDATFLVTMHLERAGLPVCSASTLRDARARLSEAQAVVSDRCLEGDDALNLFREGRPKNIRYAILVTGDEVPMATVQAAGFDDLAKKPLDAQRLIRKLREVCT